MCFSFRPTFLFLALIFLPVLLTAQTSKTVHQQVLTLKRTIELNHYNPRPVDDNFSSQLYDRFLAHIDPDKHYFSPSDLKTLSAYRLTLDDELNGRGWEFLNKLIPLYKTALQKADSLASKSKDGRSFQHEVRKMLDHPSGYENYVASIYCDVIANLFDPHTEYMPLEEKQDFETSLDKKGYYFGFSLEENDNGNTEIGRLVPGSPAWKCGDLNKGDVVTRIGWEGKATVDVSGLHASEISELLQSADTAQLHLTVKKQDGIEKTISLTRAKIDNEENNVRGYVLKGNISVGYIYLPDFYTAHESGDASCANDVAKEIVKLKKENIAGLILDIRYNGGGSLQEALDMAGIFIDAGPLVMMKDKAGKIFSLKDPNRGTIYDGPMTLLVNGQSASASELLGAVLQDYHRAVIVGSTTFGKGSAQVIFPVDTNNTMPIPSRNTQYGFVKITTNKFYRVTGGTTQHAGVTPDIVLPDIFDGLNYHESALPSALTADTIKKNDYYTPLANLPLTSLAAKSKLRVNVDSNFAQIRKYSVLLKEGKDAEIIDFSAIKKPTTSYAVTVNAFDASMLKSDNYREELTNQWIQKISSDKYVEEAYHILNDLINNNVNN